jgi:hypothetical protein
VLFYGIFTLFQILKYTNQKEGLSFEAKSYFGGSIADRQLYLRAAVPYHPCAFFRISRCFMRL